ncbi:MAG TPA: FHA domain-containing protein [Micromonosporaceae bacterium]
MRFAVSQVLDAMEHRVSTDPLLVGAVLDLGEIVRLADLDGGRQANVLRLGHVIDALGRHLSDSTVAVFAVADRALLSDIELSSNERMVMRRWSDDGLIEVLPNGGPPAGARVTEVSALTGLPVLSRDARYGGHRLVPMAAPGGATLTPAAVGAAPARPPAHVAALLARQWRCSEPDCPGFGQYRSAAQPPPQFRGGTPVCPRHGQPLADAGPRPPALAVTARIDGVAQVRFPVTAAQPVAVGRAPDEPDGVQLGPHLNDEAVRRVSRSHAHLELRGEQLMVTDNSTNGTTVLARSGPDAAPRRITLTRGQPYLLSEWDTVLLHDSVELGRADRWTGHSGAQPTSVLADAPTMAIRVPRG